MAEIVYDAQGNPFELRSGGASVSGMHRSIREAMGHARSVSSVLDDEQNRDPLTRALLAMGVLRPDEALGLPFAELRAKAQDVLADGSLALVPHVPNRRLMGTVYEPPPERVEALVANEPEVRATHTLEVRLVDASGEPVANEPFVVTLPGGGTREGRLDARGIALLTGIVDAGTCRVSFPRWDKDCWKPA